ncbi:MAG: SRPBCC family protein [Solirubrobacterales bacterium]
MGRASQSILVGASLAETWDHYFDPRGWPAWVDGFQAVEAAEGYPEVGGTLRWRSLGAGRGRVGERVLEHEPRRRHRIAFEDPQSAGELETTFAIEGEGTRVTLQVEYRLPGRGPFVWLTDRLFVRGQVQRSLQRSLLRLQHEVEELSELGDAPSRRAGAAE